MEKLSMETLGRKSLDAFRAEGKFPYIIVLDNVRSGLNVGSVFRTCDAFAFEKVILCGITAQPPHREILKTALGSTESVSWTYFSETTEAIAALKNEGWEIWAVEQVREKTWLQDFSPKSEKKYAFLFGNEVEGVSLEALALCDGVLEIPQFGTKHSLNVAVSVGIVAWEISRTLAKSA